MGRAPCCDKVGLKKGRWTAEEDAILAKYIADHGEGGWRALPKNAGLLRCGKSCRLRWINYLRADVKRGNISKQEEETIIRLRATLGNRWSLIANHLPGRTDNEIKNYWNSHLSRRIDTFRPRPSDDNFLNIDLSKMPGGGKRRGGRKKGTTTKTTAAVSSSGSGSSSSSPPATCSDAISAVVDPAATAESFEPLDFGDLWEAGPDVVVGRDYGPVEVDWEWTGPLMCDVSGQAGPLNPFSIPCLDSIESWLFSDDTSSL